MNIIDEIKAFMAVRKGINQLQQPSSLDLFDPAHLGALLAIAGTVYSGVKSILPPQTAIYIGVGLSLLFLLYSFILKLNGQAVQPIPGINPTIDPTQLEPIIAALEAKYPKLTNIEQVVKDVVESAKPQPAPAAPQPGDVAKP